MTQIRTQRRRWIGGRGALRARGHARRSLAFLLVAIALVFAQGSRLGHMLLVQHSLCEHGALVEGEHHAEAWSTSPDYRGASSDRRDTAAVGEAGRDHGQDHDHCDAASIVHRVDLTTASILCASLLYIEPAGGSERAEVRAVSPIDLAPKASPPRA